MKTQTLAYLAGAAVAGFALWKLWQAIEANRAPSLGAFRVVAPGPGLVDVIGGNSWGAAGADLSRGFVLPDAWGSP